MISDAALAICQPGAHWIHEGGCAVLEQWLLAAMGVTFLDAGLVAWRAVVRAQARRRPITRPG